jgi:hypothetical protein
MSHNHSPKEDLMLSYIIISRDKKIEKKCTLYPLRKRPDFSFRTKKDPGGFRPNSILLFPDGEPLSTELVHEIKEQLTATDNKKDTKELDIVLVDSR